MKSRTRIMPIIQRRVLAALVDAPSHAAALERAGIGKKSSIIRAIELLIAYGEAREIARPADAPESGRGWRKIRWVEITARGLAALRVPGSRKYDEPEI